MPQVEPRLSVVVVVGPLRERGQHVLDALAAQTIVRELEVIVVDLCAPDTPRLDHPPGLHVDYVGADDSFTFGEARAAGVAHTHAPLIAFIEDHCFPEPEWAAALVDAFRGPWVAVGYAFTNANPATYTSRACLMTDYGLWAHPAPHGPNRLMPGNNIAYTRALLDSFGDRLPAMLDTDFSVHEVCVQRGLPMFVESRALAAHLNFEHLPSMLRANHDHCRIIAGRRIELHAWSLPRRLFYALAVPLGAPVLKFTRLVGSLRGRRALWPEVAVSLPVIVSTFIWSAVGEAKGYLFGPGETERTFRHWEIEAVRRMHAEPWAKS